MRGGSDATLRILVFLAFLLVGAGGLLGYYFFQKAETKRTFDRSSDARDIKGTLEVGVDSWIGYFPLCSSEMRKRMLGAGYLVKCVDDSANYPNRMAKLAKGELDLAVATIDSYLLNGAAAAFPGVIAAVIDQSKGGDAFVARKEKIASLEQLKSMRQLKIAFTPASPSHHLLKGIALHFDIPLLKASSGDWRVETNGSEEALRKLVSGEVQAAVLWEPDVAKALSQKAMTKLLSSADTDRLIVDILLAGRDLAARDPETLKLFLSHYFRTLKHYREHPKQLHEEVVATAKVTSQQASAMLGGVAWATLNENATQWFGIAGAGKMGQDGLVSAIDSTVQILIDSGDFRSNPLPGENPYQIQNRSFVEDLFLRGPASDRAEPGGAAPAGSLERDFPALDEAGWRSLREVGALKILPITFQSGTSDLSFEGKLELDRAAENLSHYPNFRITIRGHTGTKGDPEENLRLSQERAEAVKRYLTITYNIDEDRLLAAGLGSKAPLPRLPGESDRSYAYRLPRVELFLVSEEL